jgi:CHAD domain-containing protein
VPRPAPIVQQDMFTEAVLHEHPKNGVRTDGRPGAGKRSKKVAVAPAPGAPVEQSPVQAVDVEDVPDHLTLAPPRPAPRRPGLIPTDIADSIGPVLGKAVADIRAHEDGSRRGGDIEDVHKMRVATRRVRAYLKAARPALDRTAADRLRGDVRELAGTLGVIRDHDVMIDRLHTEAAQLGDPDTGGLEHLISRLETERIAGRDRLVSELDDPSYQALLAELEEAAAQPPVADPWADLHELAADEWRTLQKAHRKLHRTFGKNPPDDELHELRIFGKRARYAAELLHEKGDELRNAGAEFGTTTGRPRRTGWYDAPVARYAARINGVTDFVLTKLDILTGMPEVPVCVAYEIDGVRHADMPMTQSEFSRAVPVYETFPGWDDDISAARTMSDLPANCQAYVRALEEMSGARISVIGVGPGRDQSIVINDLLA